MWVTLKNDDPQTSSVQSPNFRLLNGSMEHPERKQQTEITADIMSMKDSVWTGYKQMHRKCVMWPMILEEISRETQETKIL